VAEIPKPRGFGKCIHFGIPRQEENGLYPVFLLV